MKFSLNRLVKGFLFIACFIAVERFCHKKTEGFRVHKILSSLPFNPHLETPALTKEELHQVEAILTQPFYFLGSGGQCYAFLSEDKAVVLKVFKHHHMRPTSFIDNLPLPPILDKLRNENIDRRKKRLLYILGSVKISAEELKEETGVIYAHLNKTPDVFNKKITLHDKLFIKHLIDVDSLEFVLQKRADLTYPTLNALLKNNESEAAKRCIDSLLTLILTRNQKGIADNDPVIDRNFGYIGEKAVEIDLGSFSKDPRLKDPVFCKEELLSETEKFSEWIEAHHPSLTPYLNEKLKIYTQDK